MNERGQIGVLVTGSHGAAWSGEGRSEHSEFLLMDAQLVQMALRKAPRSEVEVYLIERGIVSDKQGRISILMSGWDRITVEWLPPGARFIVREYDGLETICLIDHLKIFTA